MVIEGRAFQSEQILPFGLWASAIRDAWDQVTEVMHVPLEALSGEETVELVGALMRARLESDVRARVEQHVWALSSTSRTIAFETSSTSGSS